ncbi:MAG: hydantoinase B/oxoprolinase family protein [Chloroflexi bacterium]|nr:hydantoinase B/oxoprolinase family protein [Chloroflexota bacterium]
MSSETPIDPISFEVIRNSLVEATEEMASALRRSAYSTNIKTRHDFSCAIFDLKMRTVAQSFSQPNHLGSLVETIPRALNAYGITDLHEGDALLVNLPYTGGVHLNDITLISPVFHQEALVGYVASLAHHVDVGGGAPASIGAFREIYQEGIIIPPVKFVRGGEINRDVFDLILAQVRAKRETAGDFRAQIAANNTGIRRLTSLLDRMGQETVARYIDELIEYTDRRTKSELAKLPHGVFESTGYMDSDGYSDEPVKLVVKLTINDDGLLFDFTGTDEQRRAPINSTFAQTHSGVAFVLKCLIDPDVPVNTGFYRNVHMLAPEGTVVNCTEPYPVVGGWETQLRLTEVILWALADAIPERVPAGTEGMICHSGFGGFDPYRNENYCFLETIAGGYGARANSDGPDAVQPHGKNTANAPIEETEVNYPVRITRYELVEDSEGPGRRRGGLGLRRDYLFPDHEASFTILADRERWGPHGLFGGLPGEKAHYVLNPDSDSLELGSKVTIQLAEDDVVSYRTCGGGGYGPPEERDPDDVLRDVRDGRISPERARKIYRVAVDTEQWKVDIEATRILRSRHSVERDPLR